MTSSTSQRRPEHAAPPDIYYNDDEARKYAQNTRMINIQSRMTHRAIELLALPQEQCYHILDVGCGSGLSGEVLSEYGHLWTGVDISGSMLGVAVKREVDGDLIHSDIGHGMMFRPASFDGCISISVLQWLCNADTTTQNPVQRLRTFFTTLHTCLRHGARAIFQFYPETPTAMQLITDAAMRSGFSGGLVVDYPNSTKAKKYFLCLQVGGSGIGPYVLPKARTGMEGDVDMLDDNDDSVSVAGSTTSNATTAAVRRTAEFVKPSKFDSKKRRADRDRAKRSRPGIKSVEWIKNKKVRMRAQGKDVKNDSKYTGRSRGPKF